MYSRHVRQWELFSYLPSISCEVIIAFLLPSTLGAKHCLVPDLQNERKQRTLGAGKWVFAHSSGTDPQDRLSAVSRLRAKKVGIGSVPGPVTGSGWPISWWPGNSRVHLSLEEVAKVPFTARSMWAIFPLNEGAQFRFLAPRATREKLAGCTAVFTASRTVQLPSLPVSSPEELWLSPETKDRACTKAYSLKVHAWTSGKLSGKEKALG